MHHAGTFVRRSEELGPLVGALDRSHPVGALDHDGALHEIAGRLGDEEIARELGRELVAPVDRHARGGGRRKEVPLLIESALHVAPIDPRIDARGPELLILDRGRHRCPEREIQVPHPQPGSYFLGGDEVGVRVRKKASVVVLHDPPLASLFGLFLDPGAVHFLVTLIALGVVDPVVERGDEPVRFVLGVAALGVVFVDDGDLAGGDGPLVIDEDLRFVEPFIVREEQGLVRIDESDGAG